MRAATASQQTPEIEQPKHPLGALTTYELRDYRRQLEHAIAYFDKQNPVPAVRSRLQARLDDMIVEQDDRARIARA